MDIPNFEIINDVSEIMLAEFTLGAEAGELIDKAKARCDKHPVGPEDIAYGSAGITNGLQTLLVIEVRAGWGQKVVAGILIDEAYPPDSQLVKDMAFQAASECGAEMLRMHEAKL
jgi:hypothetical protein